MIEHWPQLTAVAIMGAHFGINAARHGKPFAEERYDVRYSIARVFVWSWILISGGFFQ
jgi:hypothetical protein